MPQAVLLLAIGAGCYAGYKVIKSALAPLAHVADFGARADRAGVAANDGAPRNLGALVWDENDKVYRPKA